MRNKWLNVVQMLAELVAGGLLLWAIVAGVVLSFSSGVGVKVPRMEIKLKGVSIDYINKNDKSIKYPGNEMVLTDAHGNSLSFDDVELKGRGNASWNMDKRSYRIELSGKTDLLGLGKAKKWGLISNYFDDTMTRNDLAYFIAGLVDEEYPIRGEFVDLSINNEDFGLYYLAKLIKVEKSSINLREPTGVIVELDNAYCEEESAWARTDTLRDCLALSETVASGEKAEEGWEDFVQAYNKYEKAIRESDYEEASKYMDMESLAQYYLVNEFASNPDMFVTSWHMYKDGLDDRIHCVLAWDFDAGFGNKNWGNWGGEFYSPYNKMARIEYTYVDEEGDDGASNEEKKENVIDEGSDESVIHEGNIESVIEKEIKKEQEKEIKGNIEKGCKYAENDAIISSLFCYATEMPEFKRLVNMEYKRRLKGKRKEIIEYIDSRTSYIRESAIHNNELWGRGDFDEAVEYLKWWVEERFNFFDENYVNIVFDNDLGEV